MSSARFDAFDRRDLYALLTGLLGAAAIVAQILTGRKHP